MGVSGSCSAGPAPPFFLVFTTPTPPPRQASHRRRCAVDGACYGFVLHTGQTFAIVDYTAPLEHDTVLTPPLDSSQFPVKTLALLNDVCHDDIERRDAILDQLNDMPEVSRHAYMDGLCDPRPYIVRATFASLTDMLAKAESAA